MANVTNARNVAIPELDAKGLRNFGFMMGGVIVAIFGLAIPFLASFDNWPIIPWIIGAVFALWALVAPGSLNVVYVPWMKLGLLLNRITTPIILGIVYYLILCPTAFFFRLFSDDPMGKKFDQQMDSYRTASQKSPPSNMEKPF